MPSTEILEEEIPYNIEQEEWIEERGYRVEAVVDVPRCVKVIRSLQDLHIGWRLVERETGNVVCSIYDCIYTNALSFFKRWIKRKPWQKT